MQRREFITLLGGAAAAWPLAARAQQPVVPVIGFLGAESPDLWANRLRAFRQGLNETGYVEGRNVAIEYRWAAGQNDRLPALAADLVRARVNVIVTPASTPAALAAKAATATVPIVFYVGGDPIELGLVASLNRPGGNLTGVTTLASEVGPKRLELLHELLPTATNIGALVNPTSPDLGGRFLRDLQAAAPTFGLQLQILQASTERELDKAFATLAQLRAGGLVIANDSFFSARMEQLVALANRHSLPTVFQFREFAAAGGLMSYGADFAEACRQVGIYTGRILKGEKPADLPAQQATKAELIINLKTAKALGLTVPTALLVRADEVIE
jgi:putative tryptophan/tyrosine transport system substrate-binding protein